MESISTVILVIEKKKQINLNTLLPEFILNNIY